MKKKKIIEDRERVAGPVVAGRLDNSNQNVFIPYSKGENPVIATEQFALPRVGCDLKSNLVLNKVGAVNKVQIAKVVSGTGNNIACMDLSSDSQYLLIGGREYNVGSYRGIGMGYIGNPKEIAPVFVGMQEFGNDKSTKGDFVVATRNKTDMVAPEVKFRVDSQGQILAEGSYTPENPNSLVNKQYLDTIIDELQAQIDALKK